MRDYPIVVIGGSAGGLTALLNLVSLLPADLPAAVLVALHLSPSSPGSHPGLLSGRGRLPAVEATHGQPILPGHIYIAPPDFHLLVAPGTLQLSHGPRENRQRPAVDPLFRSAARAYGPRIIGVVLSGTLDDGTAGLLAVKARGGIALVQDPQEASFPGMPQSAIDHVRVDAVLDVAGLAQRLTELAQAPPAIEPRQPTPAKAVETNQELESTQLAKSTLERTEHPGVQSEFGCPDCGGVLWEIDDGSLVRYRCRVGHALTSRALLAAQSAELENALWTALRALEEKIALTHTMAARNSGAFRESLLEDAQDALRHADNIRKMLQLEKFQIRE